MLETSVLGEDESAVPIVIAHGLFGSARNWGAIAKRLSDTRKIVAVDMRNHGLSPWFDTHTYPDMAGDLAEVIASLGGVADVVGHSMGGKAAMMLALLHPGAVNRLIVGDISPVSYGHSQQRFIDAMRGLPLDMVSTRGDADERLRASVAEDGVRAFLLQSLDVKAKKWRLNLDVLEADMADILGWPEVNADPFEKPVLFLSGALSDYVQAEHRPAIKALFPNAKFAKIPGAGHWLHAEKPREFEATIRAFLAPDAAI